MECLFSENLKNFRLEKKISQKKLAELLAVSQQCVSEWENGHNQPTLTSLLRLSEIFEISIDELVGKI
jgi:transcriptional regulator with XRE-family HTH domain